MLAELAKAGGSTAHGSWTRSDLLLGEVIDLLGRLIRLVVQAFGGKPPEFKPYPRPGVGGPKPLTPEQEKFIDDTEAQREAHRARRRAAGLE